MPTRSTILLFYYFIYPCEGYRFMMYLTFQRQPCFAERETKKQTKNREIIPGCLKWHAFLEKYNVLKEMSSLWCWWKGFTSTLVYTLVCVTSITTHLPIALLFKNNAVISKSCQQECFIPIHNIVCFVFTYMQDTELLSR